MRSVYFKQFDLPSLVWLIFRCGLHYARFWRYIWWRQGISNNVDWDQISQDEWHVHHHRILPRPHYWIYLLILTVCMSIIKPFTKCIKSICFKTNYMQQLELIDIVQPRENGHLQFPITSVILGWVIFVIPIDSTNPLQYAIVSFIWLFEKSKVNIPRFRSTILEAFWIYECSKNPGCGLCIARKYLVFKIERHSLDSRNITRNK